MYKYFIVNNGKYSHAYQNQETCKRDGKYISAMYQCEVYVVDDSTAEVLEMFWGGLSMS